MAKLSSPRQSAPHHPRAACGAPPGNPDARRVPASRHANRPPRSAARAAWRLRVFSVQRWYRECSFIFEFPLLKTKEKPRFLNGFLGAREEFQCVAIGYMERNYLNPNALTLCIRIRSVNFT